MALAAILSIYIREFLGLERKHTLQAAFQNGKRASYKQEHRARSIFGSVINFDNYWFVQFLVT